jgi:hypothetical protein
MRVLTVTVLMQDDTVYQDQHNATQIRPRHCSVLYNTAGASRGGAVYSPERKKKTQTGGSYFKTIALNSGPLG